VTGAIARVSELTRSEQPHAQARYDKALDDVVARGKTWADRDGVRADSVRATLAREASILARARLGLREYTRGLVWTWKMITISPQWAPDDPRAYTVQGLRERLDDVVARWRRLWAEGLGVQGLASAYLRVELSAHGHVHAHILYFGPWWSQKWLCETTGCHVWIEKVDDTASAIREATKYALKSPTPGAAWISGAPRYAAHPELAARWQVATRRRRLVESYGVMRLAVRMEELAQGGSLVEDSVPPEPPPAPRCASCGCELDDVDVRWEPTVAVAKRLGAKFNSRPSQHPIFGHLPARVSFTRTG
jgi:hypothetical protein